MNVYFRAPETLLDFLLNKKKAYALAWSWNQIHSLQANKLILPNLARIFVDCLNRTVTDPDKDLIQIIENMPKPLVFEFYDMSLSNFR